MKYILTGGGTGGHIYPALAIAEQIRKNEPDAEFLYLGTKKGIESKIVPAKGYRMKYVSATGMPDKKISIAMIVFVLMIFSGTVKSVFILLSYRPDMIIGSGGYVSAPPIFAGYILRKLRLSRSKLFLHEANAEAGKLVKLAGPLCDGVGVSYKISLKDFPGKGRFVGYPVRPEFFTGSKAESREKLGLNNDDFVVFAVGGSQGARTINRAVVDCLKYLNGMKNLRLIHVTGRGTEGYNSVLDTIKRIEYNSLKESEIRFYNRIEYADNIKDYYFAADLIITRGGGTINEIAVSGTPSLIIPKANLSGDHQVMNALSMQNSGAADIMYEEVMIEENDFVIKVTGEKLSLKIKEYYDNRDRLRMMSANALKAVISNANEEIYSYITDVMNNIPHSAVNDDQTQKNKNIYSEMGVNQILSYLSKMSSDEILNLEYLDYIKYRASYYLISQNWKVKNSAVKLAGLTQDRTKLPFLSKLLSEKNAGFVKRNVIEAYRRIGIYDENVERDIFHSLSDTYWEVQVEALKCVLFFKEETKNNDKMKKVIIKLLENGNYEVIMNAIPAFTIYVETPDDLKEFVKFRYHSNTNIRESLITALNDLKKRNIITGEVHKEHIDNMLLTSTGFTPFFSMKSKLKEAGLS
ncbi:MAG TPA: glycosyltransferase [Clostridiales bacterium]|nr:glycosyltransferase [Clostridiales bacterium]HQP69624.1 glycosyltransferase [Clostridiales bacterium]